MEWIGIAAVGTEFQLGLNGSLPWKDTHVEELKEDQQRFKTLTTGHVCLMGSKTYDSLPKLGLPNRTVVVLTSKTPKSMQPKFVMRNVYFWNPSEDCTQNVIALDAFFGYKQNVFVCGGASVYEQYLPYCNRVELTEIPYEGPADVYFPQERLRNFSRHMTWNSKTFADYHMYYWNSAS